MREWPMLFRYDRGIMERTCEHGTGHPDPDDAAYRLWFYETYDKGDYDPGVHGCDLCCGSKTSQALAAERAKLKQAQEFPTPNGGPTLHERLSGDASLTRLLARDENGSGLSPGGSCRG
jgi:hypothetical protein